MSAHVETTEAPPVPLSVRPGDIPASLKAFRSRWTPCVFEWLPEKRKYTKVPRVATQPESRVSVNQSWWSFPVAENATRDLQLTEYAGLGFRMTGVQDLVGIDLDKCVQDGQLEPWAAEIVKRSGSYAELSPSGTGVRIFVQGQVARDQQKPIEVYGGHAGRFLTVTGHRLPGSPAEVLAPPPDFWAWLNETYPPPEASAATAEADMPELLAAESLTTVESLALHPATLEFLQQGAVPEHGDRSRALAAAAANLYEATAKADGTLDDALVFSLLAHNEHARSVALDHRRGDEERALAYLWQHHCRPARGKVTPAVRDFDAIDTVRRERQQAENERIGELGPREYPKAERITLKEALERFAFVSDGSGVADLHHPAHFLNFTDWAATFVASKERIALPGEKPKDVAVAALWKSHPARTTVHTRTFKAGDVAVVQDPDGRLALNLWCAPERTPVSDLDAAGLGLFLRHVDFLFSADAARFLDWLAHIEQRPGELPHTGWLHIATRMGLGRNWLAGVLVRLWPGAVAASLDLTQLLATGFNGRLSRKILAVVDEIREGGRDGQWAHAETLKRIVTEETRLINPKYGRQYVEYNAGRWLMFSNHISALPLEDGDRRWEVAHTDAHPQSAAYYAELYAALARPAFIAAVAQFLGSRDISAFNPGAHARRSTARSAVVKASQTPTAEACELLVTRWPSDLILARDLSDVITQGVGPQGSLNAAHRRTLEQYGIQSLQRIKLEGETVRLSAIRNVAKWQSAAGDELRAELLKAAPGLDGAWSYLENLAAIS